MEVDGESTASTATASGEPSTSAPDGQSVVSPAHSTPPQPVQPIIPPPLAPPPIVPAIPPIPAIPPPQIPRPLAPLPVRPPVSRPPPVSDNGEARSSDSDSDDDDTRRINQSTGGYEISEESRMVRERQEKAMQELMMKRRAAALAVPTNDKAVRARLRRLGEPITLFGEREMERRDRLRMIMAKLDAEGQLEKLMKAHEDEEAALSAVKDEAEEELQYPFYTEGSKTLLDARIYIAKYSLARAALRLERARRKRDDPDEDPEAELDWALKQAGNLVLDCSEIGDDRPLSGCSFSPNGEKLATWYFSSTPCSPLPTFIL